MSEKFYDIVNGSGRGLKAVWDKVSGVSMLRNRNIESDAYEHQGALMFAGMMAGLVGGFLMGVITDNSAMLLYGPLAGMSLPVTGHLPYALYKAGEHDRNLRIAQEERKLLEAPKPQLPPPQSGLI